MNGRLTHIAQVQRVEAGSDEVGVVGDQGESVQGFRIPGPVQALQVRQVHGQCRTPPAERTGEEQAALRSCPSRSSAHRRNTAWPAG